MPMMMTPLLSRGTVCANAYTYIMYARINIKYLVWPWWNKVCLGIKTSGTRNCIYIIVQLFCIPVPISFLTQKGHRNMKK